MKPATLLLELFCLVFTCNCQATSLNGDMPTWVYVSTDWNIDTDNFYKLEEKFGDATKWHTGDALCAQENRAYQTGQDNIQQYLVFFEGELGDGFRLTNAKALALDIGYSGNCRDLAAERLKLPKFPLKKIKNTFHSPVELGVAKDSILSKLKSKGKRTKEGDIEFYSFSWETTGASDIQSGLKLGFANKKLVYFQVDRFAQ